MGYHEIKKLREIQHMLGSRAFSAQAIKDTVKDWALTLDVHPWKLGVLRQDHGNARIPGRLKVSCKIAQDLFDLDKLEKRRVVGSEAPIPTLSRT